MSATGTEHGLNARPLMWQVQALHTPRPQPYLGPLTPRRSRRTHSRRTPSSQSTETDWPLRMKVCVGMLLEGVLQAVGGGRRDRGDGGQRREAEGEVVVDGEAGRHRAGRA